MEHFDFDDLKRNYESMRTHCTDGIIAPFVILLFLCLQFLMYFILPYTCTYYIVSLLVVMYFSYSYMYIYMLHCLALRLSNQVRQHHKGFHFTKGRLPFISIPTHDIQY